MQNEQTKKLFLKLFIVLTSSLYYRVNLFATSEPFCMALLLNGTFCFSWHFENDIDDFLSVTTATVFFEGWRVRCTVWTHWFIDC